MLLKHQLLKEKIKSDLLPRMGFWLIKNKPS
jgi:hypothetical protein